MNKDIAEQWADALESGEYQQGPGALTRISPAGIRRHCCLGVLTDLAVKAGITREMTGPHTAMDGIDRLVQYYSYTSDAGDELSEGAYLPRCVREWAGIDGMNPQVLLPDGVPESMAGLNDNRSYDFTQIARVIREQLADREDQA